MNSRICTLRWSTFLYRLPVVVTDGDFDQSEFK